MINKILNKFYPRLDRFYRYADKKDIGVTNNLGSIPELAMRIGGKRSYAEWAYVIGIFQTLIHQNIKIKSGANVLDVGCGTGLLGMAAEPFTHNNGRFTGIDVQSTNIDFCKNHYDFKGFEFIHFDASNSKYNSSGAINLSPWPITDSTYDMITALSVWTHLNEKDSMFYIKEVARTLKTGARAIITFFILDDDYQDSLLRRIPGKGRFNNRIQNRWIFDQPAYGSSNWFCPDWIDVPEGAIGVTKEGLEQLLQTSGLKLIEHYPGNWKEIPGVYFQDVLVLEKTA